MKKGLFIVFEGIDHSGKATQSQLLVQHLKESNRSVKLIHFPQYGQKSAGLVENYLEGKYGTAEEVGPYRASVFFAVDRYDESFFIRKELAKGKIIIADRYWASNVGHQGGKIKDQKERDKFIDWLYQLEFEIFSIPKPDITFFLNTSPEIVWNLKKKGVEDIHEKDLEHERRAFQIYLEVAKKFPQDFQIIECLEENHYLPASIIHKKVWSRLENFLY